MVFGEIKKDVSMEQIAPDTWVISEGTGRGTTHSYLVIGQRIAALIDTGRGMANMGRLARRKTDKEVVVINTHGHLDHVSKNHQFDTIYLHPKDQKLYYDGIDYEKRKRLFAARFIQKGVPAWLVHSPLFRPVLDPLCRLPQKKDYIPLTEGMVIDLGGRTLRVIETPGHTMGSVCLLDAQHRLLFTGDTICEQGMLLNFDHSSDLPTFRSSLVRLKELEAQYDSLYSGHQRVPLEKAYVEEYLECVDAITRKCSTDTQHQDTTVSMWKRAVISHSETNRRNLFD